MGRLSPELEKFFAEKGVNTDELSLEDSPAVSPSRPPVSRPIEDPKKEAQQTDKIRSLLNYVLGFKELRSWEKLIILAAVEAHILGSFYQARIKTICAQASCSRATTFRALNRIVPKWVTKVSRPGKPNILRPSPMLLKYLKLIPKKRNRGSYRRFSRFSNRRKPSFSKRSKERYCARPLYGLSGYSVRPATGRTTGALPPQKTDTRTSPHFHLQRNRQVV